MGIERKPYIKQFYCVLNCLCDCLPYMSAQHLIISNLYTVETSYGLHFTLSRLPDVTSLGLLLLVV